MKPPFWSLLITLIGSCWYPSDNICICIWYFFFEKTCVLLYKVLLSPYTHFLIKHLILPKTLPVSGIETTRWTTRICFDTEKWNPEVLESSWSQGHHETRRMATTFTPQEIAGLIRVYEPPWSLNNPLIRAVFLGGKCGGIVEVGPPRNSHWM